ncbi:MAG: hypothetical protein QOE36_785 [Gaiellaceae bacterium]|nr:hypothetical protein [Gaiellaceae bacterium]
MARMSLAVEIEIAGVRPEADWVLRGLQDDWEYEPA